MIFAHWDTPFIKQKDVEQITQINPPEQLSLFVDTGGLFVHKLKYDPTGPVPFPKNHDLDDKTIETDPDAIGKLLAKYSIVCPGAESVEIYQDSSDPLVTVFTIKKTFF